MIHNKHFEILKQFSGDYTKEVYGRALVNKVNISQKGIALMLDELEEEGILKSTKKGNVKFFKLNLEFRQIKGALAIVEITKKSEFLSKHKKLEYMFNNDERVVGIFGSYAKGTQKPDSDIDLFIIGKKVVDDYSAKGEKFDLNISIKYLAEKEFKELLNSKNTLIKEIVENHVIIFNVEKFINLLWEDYYGYN